MKLTPEAEKVRDELAERYCAHRSKYEESCVWDADSQGFKKGFDAGYAHARQEAKVLVEALEDYGDVRCKADIDAVIAEWRKEIGE